jgi:transcriptional coactivator HFI1/ADA1
MLPICFEEGLFNGHTSGTPAFMNIATEIHIKDFLTRMYTSTRSNGPRPSWVKTAQYKRRFLHEEELFERGEVRKSVTGYLPVEQESESHRQPLGVFDVRLNLELGGSILGTTAPKSMRMFETLGIDDEAGMRDSVAETLRHKKAGMMAPPKPLTNGVLTNGVMTNGVHRDISVDDDNGWAGGTDSDRMELDKILDDCMAGGF